MNHRFPKFLLCTCFLLLMISIAFGGFVICPKCGYENKDVRQNCTHCNAPLENSVSQVEPPSLVSSDDATMAITEIPGAVVDQELELGKSTLEQGDIELARFFFINAVALDLISDNSGSSGRSEKLANLIKRCEVVGTRVRRNCPTCSGTGKKVLATTGLSGEVTYREVPGATCSSCGGRGSIMVKATMDERMFARGRAASRFATLQRSRKYEMIGECWVPPQFATALTAKQTALIKTCTARPCEECMGFGRTNCRECNGKGRVECPGRGCKDGMVSIETGGLLSGTEIKRKERCTVCGGKGTVVCDTCRGIGSLLCRECQGRGTREPCRKCGGGGLAECRECNGRGVNGNVPCLACQGTGQVLCSSCKGDGRKP